MPPNRALRALLAVGLLVVVAGAAPIASADDGVPGPTPTAVAAPSDEPAPTAAPTPSATVSPPPSATAAPKPSATVAPTPSATVAPSARPAPTVAPTPVPSSRPQPSNTPVPTTAPSAAPTAVPSASPAGGTAPAWTGLFNLYRSAAWVRQYRGYTCTAASAQTMLNLILHRSDRSVLQQLRIIKYARAHDSLRSSAGSDPAGWARAVTHFGGGTYSWHTFPTRATALRYAATRMLVTGKPVGLLVWRGRHAWTMTGFTSATDPRRDRLAVVTGIFVAPPLVGVDPRPNTYLRAATLATFARYRERDGLKVWVGRWVVVAP